jgi:single-strand DNA-binding protein
MMNKAILMGRLTRDPEMRTTTSQIPVCTFTVAIDRRFKNASGEREADFINCVAWRQQAEFISKFFSKGNKIAVIGSIQTRNWDDNDGNKRTATEVIIDEAHFVESKSGGDTHYKAPEGEPSLPFDL